MTGTTQGKNMKREHCARTHRGEWARRSNRGQAIILVAFVFVALALFTGLVVDGGTVLARYAQLRRSRGCGGGSSLEPVPRIQAALFDQRW